MAMSGRVFSASGLLIRLLLAMFIVLSTYNPTGYSYYHWATGSAGNLTSKIFLGVLLFTANLVLLATSYDALKRQGIALVLVNYAAFIWWLDFMDFIDLSQGTTRSMSALMALAVVNAVGLSFSLLVGRLSGLVHIA